MLHGVDRTRSEREYWEFGFTAEQISAAITACIEEREGKLDNWSAEMDKAEQELRTNGLTFEERYGTYTSDGGGFEARVEAGLEKRYSIARSAVKEHERVLKTYRAYAQAFASVNPSDQLFALKVEDVEFFGIGRLIEF